MAPLRWTDGNFNTTLVDVYQRMWKAQIMHKRNFNTTLVDVYHDEPYAEWKNTRISIQLLLMFIKTECPHDAYESEFQYNSC